MLQYLVLVGAVVQLAGVFYYIREIIRSNVKPNRVTWLMWSIAPFIATVAALSAGVRLAVLPVFMSGFGPFLVFVASFLNPKSYWKLERFDYICGFFSLLALVIWGITGEPRIAIAFAIISDAFAAIPTLVKSWKFPETETTAPYTTGIFNSLTSFAAIKLWTFSEYAFPLYLVFMNTLLVFFVYRKKLSIN